MSTDERHQYGQDSEKVDAGPVADTVDAGIADLESVVDHAASPKTVEEAGRLVPRSAADETETDDGLDGEAKPETFEDEPTADDLVAELTPEELASAARMSGIFTDRDALAALAAGLITRGDARNYLAATDVNFG